MRVTPQHRALLVLPTDDIGIQSFAAGLPIAAETDDIGLVAVLAATVGMMLLAGASSLMVIFLAIELLSLALYVLSGFARHEELANWALAGEVDEHTYRSRYFEGAASSPVPERSRA